MNTAAVEFDGVDILFSAESGRKRDAAIKAALKLLDAGQDRNEIETATGVVVGVSKASLTVQRGQISVLMGLSGSGKSTLLRAANGLNRVTRGRVHGATTATSRSTWRACDAATPAPPAPRHDRHDVPAVRPAAVAHRARERRARPRVARRIRRPTARRIVDEKLQLVGLERWADRYGHELSGGMQQRVGLARAFATDAPILLMDEPFSALDPLIRNKLQDELLALQARVRKTIVFVTHDLDEALKLGNQTSVLEGGRIVQTGTPEDIVLRPANAYVGEFVAAHEPVVGAEWPHGDARRGATSRPTAPSAGSTRAAQFSAVLDEQGRPVAAAFEGRALALRTAATEGEGLIVADIDTPLRQLIQWCRSGNPVLLAEGGAVQGVCGPTDVIRALATSDARAHAHP